MAGRRPSDRGKRYERELADYLTTTTGHVVRRTSITQQIFDRRRGNPDLIGLPLLALEAKRVENLNFRAALRQSARNAAPGELPVVITRRDRESTGESVVFLHLDDFLHLYNLALTAAGLVPKPPHSDDSPTSSPLPSEPDLPF